MTKTNDKQFEKTWEEFQKLQEIIKDKVRELLEVGTLTPDMLTFEFYDGEQDVDVDYTIAYDNNCKNTTLLHKRYIMELSIEVREKDWE